MGIVSVVWPPQVGQVSVAIRSIAFSLLHLDAFAACCSLGSRRWFRCGLYAAPKAIETQAVADYADRGQRHSSGSEDGADHAEHGQRDQDRVVEEGPEQILADGAHGGTRERDRGGQAPQ